MFYKVYICRCRSGADSTLVLHPGCVGVHLRLQDTEGHVSTTATAQAQQIRYRSVIVSSSISRWRFGSVGNVVGRINEVKQRRARLLLLRATAGTAIARLSHRNSVRLSVCLSVRPSVTRVDQAKTVQARIIKSSPSVAPKTLVSGSVTLFQTFHRGHPNRGP